MFEAMLEDRIAQSVDDGKVDPKLDVVVEAGVGLKFEPRVDVKVEVELDVKVEPAMNVKIKARLKVMKDPMSSSLSVRKSHSTLGDYCPTFCEGKRYRFVPEQTLQHYMEESRDIRCTILNYNMIPAPGYGIVFTIETHGSIENQEVYEITLSNIPTCTCLGFISMKGPAPENGRKKWILYKHLYFVL